MLIVMIESIGGDSNEWHKSCLRTRGVLDCGRWGIWDWVGGEVRTWMALPKKDRGLILTVYSHFSHRIKFSLPFN